MSRPATVPERDVLRARRSFDYRVWRAMSGSVFHGEAFANADDMRAGRNPIVDELRSGDACRYRMVFTVPTLTAPGEWASETVIGFDLNVRGYPVEEPVTWIESAHVPFSPHFRRGAPVCLGEIWRESGGRMLLGQLCVHIARLLNWDEVARGGGYVGWNPAAVAYRQEHYRDRPLDPSLRYPTLPAEVTHGMEPGPLFGGRRDEPAAATPSAGPVTPDGSLFAPRGSVA